jgi:hypothetical protein
MGDCMDSQDTHDIIKVKFMDMVRKVGQEITRQVESNYLEMHNYRNVKW